MPFAHTLECGINYGRRGDRNLHSIDPAHTQREQPCFLSLRPCPLAEMTIRRTHRRSRFAFPTAGAKITRTHTETWRQTHWKSPTVPTAGDEREARVPPVLQSAQPFLISRIATPSRASPYMYVSTRAWETRDKKAPNLPTRLHPLGEPSQCSRASQQVHAVIPHREFVFADDCGKKNIGIKLN